MHSAGIATVTSIGVEIRVRGRVQGVGFRPAVWRLARELGLAGEVLNDGEGLLIRAEGTDAAISLLLRRLKADPPPLARIDRIETRPLLDEFVRPFRIGVTRPGAASTEVAPDAAICDACAAEVLDPTRRRYRYPFANCTHCGPRLTIVHRIPYDRRNTAMAGFDLCAACLEEYRNPSDRRFHAEPIACPACGPMARVVPLGERGALRGPVFDAAEAVARLLSEGYIVALKGLGGYQLACKATDAGAVARLRLNKHREAKPFALMARDLGVIRRFCRPTEEETRALVGPERPIVLLRAAGPEWLPDEVAPGVCTLGFMLPTTPLHLLMLCGLEHPVVLTSGNVSGEPQLVDDDEALAHLNNIADYACVHDRPITNRMDDSVVRVMGGRARVLRRARGYAPAAMPLPEGFESAPDLLALGGDLKSAFCLVKDGHAILSQHHGDLDDAATFDDFRRNLARYSGIFDHVPCVLAADMHPQYRSSKVARSHASEKILPLIEVQHHHAHVAACLSDNLRPLAAPPVLGIVLDGTGWGADGGIWGGEFLLADYRNAQRLAMLKPVALLGGDRAAREPWRNLYAHLMAGMGWAEFTMNFAQLEIHDYLAAKPRQVLEAMSSHRLNSPLASSCGRLFDAVAAALDICRERQSYEGEAAAALEAIVDERTLRVEGDELAYPFAFPTARSNGLPYVEPLAMWRALLGDLILETPASVVAARFHKGFARALAAMAAKLAHDGGRQRFDTVALSGGCFQNELLLAETTRRLEAGGLKVLSHARVPCNDGGIALGQAAVVAARSIAAPKK